MFYETNLKTKEDCEILLQEIEAYRTLDSEEFNFNGETLRNDNQYGYGSEDAYYEMEIQTLEDLIEYWEISSENRAKKDKPEKNNYLLKMHYKFKYKNKRCKKFNNKIDRIEKRIRQVKIGEEDFAFKGRNYKKKF